MSYFALPKFIVYDEWFDNDLNKIRQIEKNLKITKISNTHEFFYEQSNYKVGASENNFQIDININEEELFNNYYFERHSEKYPSLSNKKFLFFEKLYKNKLKFNITKKKIYSLTIIVFVLILGLLIFSISMSKKNAFNIIDKSTLL